jgi:nitroreductase
MERTPDYEIDPQFVQRWSPRAMSGQAVSETEIMRLFEAARWAPSSGNSQPWRFVYGLAGTPHFDRLFDLLVEANRSWCVRAGALVVALSKAKLDNGNPLRTHSYDTGAAWMSLALEGQSLGLVVHGMAGFNYDRARADLGVPDDYSVEAMIAVGHPGTIDDLSEKDRAREKPSPRRPLQESVFEGRFPT